MGSHFRCFGIHFGSVVAEDDEGFGGAGVLEGDALLGGAFGGEEFVLREFVEAEEFGAVEAEFVGGAFALDDDGGVGAVVFDGGGGAGVDGEFFGGEVLEVVDFAVDDPFVVVALTFFGGDGFEVVVVFEVGVEVFFPVELVDDEVDVLVFVLGHVFDEEGPGDFAAFDEVLIHAEDVGSPLGFVGAEGAGGVEDAGVDEPTGAGLEFVGFGEFEDFVVAFVPVGDAVVDLLAGGAGFEAHEGVGEVVADVVVLGGEVVGFGFAFLVDEGGLFGALVHVVGDGTHVVEEFGVDGPFSVFVPDGGADDAGAAGVDGVTEGEAFVSDDDVGEAFVGVAAFVGGFGGGAEPAFVDAAAAESVGVGVVGVEFDAKAGLEEGAGGPRWGKVGGVRRCLRGGPRWRIGCFGRGW